MKAKYTSAEELETNIQEYFSSSDAAEKPYTFAGLAHYLGFSTRQSLWEYSKRGDELSLPTKRALLYIEADYEAQLRSGSPTGAIFALKNRGWTDKQEVEHSGKSELNIKVEYVG